MDIRAAQGDVSADQPSPPEHRSPGSVLNTESLEDNVASARPAEMAPPQTRQSRTPGTPMKRRAATPAGSSGSGSEEGPAARPRRSARVGAAGTSRAGPDAAAGPADSGAGPPPHQRAAKRTRPRRGGSLFSNQSAQDEISESAEAAPSSVSAHHEEHGAPGGGETKVESTPQPPDGDSSSAADGGPSAGPAADLKPDCGICLETCLHPVRLPCGHIFCFLCVKGAVKQSQRCAYCRADVPDEYINNPRLLDEAAVEREMATSHGYQWLYKGRNGWWRYDERTSREIEEAFSAQQTSLQIQVAGELYTIDLVALTQYNDDCRGRRRRIRREASDAATVGCKGVAGLRKRPRRQ